MLRYVGSPLAVSAGLVASIVYIGNAAAQEAAQPATPTELPALEVTAKTAKAKKKAVASKKPAPVAQPVAAPVAQTEKPSGLDGTPNGPANGPVSGYSATSAASGLKVDTPLLETPQSVSVVTRDLIEDRSSQTVNEALGTVPGFNAGGSYQFNDAYSLRGFITDYSGYFDKYRDGRRTLSYADADPEVLERIEVVRGPAGMLFGALEPGGLINQVTKMPVLGFNGGWVKQEIGSFDFAKTVVDANASTDTVGVRVPIAYTDSNSFRDYVDSESFSIAPTFTWKVTPDTRVSLLTSYTDRKTTNDAIGTPVINGEIASFLPRSRFLGQPDYEQGVRFGSVALEVEHKFAKDVTLHSSVSYFNGESDTQSAGTIFGFTPPSDLSRFPTIETQDFRAYATQHDLTIKGNTFGMDHALLVGTDMFWVERRQIANTGLAMAPINIFNPVYDGTVFDADGLIGDYDGTFNDRLIGVYIQDQVTLIKNAPLIHKLDVMGGVRYDWIDQTADASGTFFGFPNPVDADFNGTKASPRAAILYMPTSRISLYGSYSTSLKPNGITIQVGGESFDPQEGEQYEVGAKYEVLTNLFASVAAFDITKTNIPAPGPFGTTILAGEAQSRGVEFELNGRLAPGWDIAAAYTTLETEITKGTNLGNELRIAPNNVFGLWTAYTMQSSSILPGFGGGVGVRYASESFDNFDNAVELPAYALVDAAIWYRPEIAYGGVTPEYAVNFKNIGDEKYYLGGNGVSAVEPGAPFTVVGSLKLKY